jgi:hypothetical protein
MANPADLQKYARIIKIFTKSVRFMRCFKVDMALVKLMQIFIHTIPDE